MAKKKTKRKSAVKAKSNDDENMIGMLAHLLVIFIGFIGPLVIFLVKNDTKGNAYENAKHALNFQISLIIYYLIAVALIFTIIGIVITIIMFIALPIFALVTEIVGSVKAYQGDVYQYPLEIHFIK